MISKHMTAALIGSALLATTAVAQTPNATTNNQMNAPAATTSSEASYHGNWRASKVIGLNVYNDSNEKLGSISELLFDKSGNVKAAVIGVGGFLGVGERLVVGFSKLKFVDTPVPSSTSASTSTGPAGTGMRPTRPEHDHWGCDVRTRNDDNEDQSLVSGSRGIQRDQGRVEVDA